MTIWLLQVPYDSGHRDERMGRGPIYLVRHGAIDRLREIDADVSIVPVETDMSFPTEIGTAFALHRAVSEQVSTAGRRGVRPLVLSGNCNSAVGTVAGLLAANPRSPVGVIWFDGHGDCNTPDTFTGDFLDAMALSTLTGRCWNELAATVSGFQTLTDDQIVLVGAHGADPGALGVLAASGIAHVRTTTILQNGAAAALAPSLDAMVAQGIKRVYVHLDVDVIDVDFAPANQFAPTGGLLPDHLDACFSEIIQRFDIAAAAVASYDPEFDHQDRIANVALRFLTVMAASERAGGRRSAPG